MRQLPLPDALKDHVADLVTEIALTDADGKVVAYLFSPDQREMFYDMGAELTDLAHERARTNPLPPDQVAAILGEMRALKAKTAKAS
jgi:hypothetical protein